MNGASNGTADRAANGTAEGRGDASVPSVMSVWRGADLQEREAYDLMGVRFEGHPNMKRLMLWEGFEGHPLRKDYLR